MNEMTGKPVSGEKSSPFDADRDWLAAMAMFRGRPWRRLLLPVLAGAALGLAFAPFNFFLLAFASLAGLFHLWRSDGWEMAPSQGYWFGIGYFAAGVHWIYYSIYTYGGTPLAVAIGLNILLVLFLALYPALLGWLGKRYYGRRGSGFQVIAFALFWAGLEWLRSVVLTGFPWLSVGYSQIDAPLAGFAPLLGIYGVSGLVALTAALLIVALTEARRRMFALSTLFTIWLSGWALLGVNWTEPVGEPVSVSIVQANFDQGEKWDPGRRLTTVQRYIDMSRQHWDADLIIWPETAVPFFYEQARPYLQQLDEDAERDGVALLVGVPVQEENGEYFNAIVGLGAAQGQYRKQHLVPFGEYVPLVKWLGELIQFLQVPMSSFSAGGEDQTPISFAGVNVGSSICYEDVFPGLVNAISPTTSLLVNVSNDGWFGNTIAPHQHLQMARMRALESGRWLLRATNTGISAIIDNHGKLLRHTRQSEAVVIASKAQRRHGITLYGRLGEGVLLLLALVFVFADRMNVLGNKFPE